MAWTPRRISGRDHPPGEAEKNAWQGKSSTEVNLREILVARRNTSDSQANRVDRIHVGYVDERARFIDRCPILLSASSTAPNPTLFSHNSCNLHPQWYSANRLEQHRIQSREGGTGPEEGPIPPLRHAFLPEGRHMSQSKMKWAQ